MKQIHDEGEGDGVQREYQLLIFVSVSRFICCEIYCPRKLHGQLIVIAEEESDIVVVNR